MKKISYLLLLAMSMAIFTSCTSSNNSTNPITGNQFPLSTGNYWVYDVIPFDSTGAPAQSSEYFDSTYVASTSVENVLTMQGVTVFNVNHIYSNSNPNTSEQYYTNSDGIYNKFNGLSGFNGNLFGINILDSLHLDWMLYIDYNNSTWTSLAPQTITFNNIPLPQVGNVDLSITFTMVGTKSTTKQFTIQGSNITAQGYISTIKITGNIKVFSLAGTIIPIPESDIVTNAYYASGIGLIYSKTDNATIGLPGLYSTTILGSVKTLVRYKVQ